MPRFTSNARGNAAIASAGDDKLPAHREVIPFWERGLTGKVPSDWPVVRPENPTFEPARISLVAPTKNRRLRAPKRLHIVLAGSAGKDLGHLSGSVSNPDRLIPPRLGGIFWTTAMLG
jgi:hypothetical protein